MEQGQLIPAYNKHTILKEKARTKIPITPRILCVQEGGKNKDFADW